MTQLILIMSVICFLSSIFWTIADITGQSSLLTRALIRIIGIAGITIPIIYWLKLANII